MSASRFVVGIDLGTTNCGLAYIDTEGPDAAATRPVHLPIPQVVAPGVVEERPLLPSFLYLPSPGELPGGSLKVPWDSGRDYTVGEFARNQGSVVPTRLVSSAKSWLCHPGVDRRAALLPWKAPEGGRRVSPLEASTLYLRHLVEIWNVHFSDKKGANNLENQDVVLTVPASFDAAARDLTVEAARAAGLQHLTLLEEPQAAFYAWLDESQDRWRQQVAVGETVLICDVGGGTTDFTLIAVGEESGQLALSRVAVGDHILLGGDNMDLALAHTLAERFAEKKNKLDTGQMLQLWHACRAAKEILFNDPKLGKTPVTVLGRGSKVIGGSLKQELTRDDVTSLLTDGFFPKCGPDAEPTRERSAGLQELGLPYASDAAVTKHLAYFLHRQAAAMAERHGGGRGVGPHAVLFNGGVFRAEPLRQRVLDVLGEWGKPEGRAVKVLPGDDLDRAVARGAAYYGLVRRGKGVRIRGGVARSYYVGIQARGLAIPGMKPRLKALCVVPFGMEEGTEAEVPGHEFNLTVGDQTDFPFLGSSVRHDDQPGTLVEEWEDEIEALSPITTTLLAPESGEREVPVHLHSRVTEVGTLELSCYNRDRSQQWKLEFNVRS